MIQTDAIPAELRGRPQWVLWRSEQRDGKGTKVPYRAVGNGMAASDNPATWAPFEVALERYAREGWDGLGYVFSTDDPYTGVDLDKCRDPDTGAVEPWATEIIHTLDSYTEVSPSGTGIHVLVRGVLPDGGRRRGPLEMYDRGRYFTITGRHLDGTPDSIHFRELELAELHARSFVSKPANGQAHHAKALPQSDEKLLSLARAASNGADFSRLWEGDWSAYPSESEADLALCNHLIFWTGGDVERADRLFRRSGLYRDKWDARHFSDGRTYGQATLDRAMQGRGPGDFYDPTTRLLLPPPGGHSNRQNGHVKRVEIVTAAELVELDLPEPRWAIPALFPEGVVLLVGKSKLGKSWLALDATLAVAQGGMAWGSIRCQPGDVLYLALEDSKRRLRDRLRALCGRKAPGRLSITTSWPRADEGGLDLILEWLEQHADARMVVIDVLGKFRPREANNRRLYDMDYEAIGPLAELARQRGVCILVVHHANKLNPEDPVDSVSGTTGLVGAADAIGIFRRERGKADASLFVTGRDVDEQDLAFRRTLGDGTGCAWQLIGDADEHRMSEERQAIVNLLTDSPGLKGNDIADILNRSRASIKSLLWKMTKRRQLRVRDGGYYTP